MKIKEIKIVNQDQSTEIANIGADAINVDYNDTTVKAELDKLNNNVDTNTTNISSEIAIRANAITNLQSQINGLASGSPLVASSIAEMTDTTRVYVNTTNGHWYYYNGNAWTDGGQYQAAEDSETVEILNNIKDNTVVTQNISISVTKNQHCINSNGEFIAVSPTYCALQYNVTNLDVIFINAITKAPNSSYRNICWLNENDTVLSSNYYSGNYIFNGWCKVPTGATKLLLGALASSYNDTTIKKLKNTETLIHNIEENLVLPMNISNYFEIDNLFDKTKVTNNKYLQPDNQMVDRENYFTTPFIPVDPTKIIYMRGGSDVYVNTYDKNFKREGTVATTPYVNMTTGNGQLDLTERTTVAYIRFAQPNIRLNTLCIKQEPIYNYRSHYTLPNANIKNLSNLALNFWEGKIGDSLGDSLTGQGFFQNYTKNFLNLKSFANHGVGGSKMTGDSSTAMWQDSRINALNTNTDFITILGGQNDGNVSIGEISKTNFDTNTYVGAINTVIQKLYNHFGTDLIIILCTPFYVPSEGENGERFKKLGDAVREIGKLQGLPVADFGANCGSNYYLLDKYWSSEDRTHPSEAFYKEKITPILVDTLRKVQNIDFTECNYI